MFWLFEEELPAGVGCAPFGAGHLAYLAFFLALALGYAFFYKRLDARRRRSADRILGAAVCFFALCAYGITALLGHFSRYALPLHVCSLLFFLTPLHARTAAARPGSFAARLHGFLGALLFHPGIPGVLAALLFPDWLDCPFWHYLSISAFMAHGLLFVYGAALLVSLAEAMAPVKLFWHDLRSSTLFLAVGALVMFFFDRATGTNYWFMAGPSSGSPFLGVYASGGFGGYLAAFALSALAVTALWYGLRYFLLVRRRNGA